MVEGQKKAGKKGRKDKAGSNLGRSIIRSQFPPTTTIQGDGVLETERGKNKLRSVTHCNDLEELMTNATLAGTDFTAKRGEMIVLGSEARQENELKRGPADMEVPIPRRPPWKIGMASSELDSQERAAFLEWRRQLAELQEKRGFLLTPFEKNLEVWRQLWRVVERSQLVVQIVDARNPLLFRSPDLERYVKEVDTSKRVLLLVNKADLLSEGQRKRWADYFLSQGISFVFWSAVAAQLELEQAARVGRISVEPSYAEERRDPAAAFTAPHGRSDSDDDGAAPVELKHAPPSAKGDEMGEEDEQEDDQEDEDELLLRMAVGSRAAGGGRLAELERELLSEEDESADDGEGEAESVPGQSSTAAEPSRVDASVELDAAGLPKPSTRVLSRDEILAMMQRVCPQGAAQADGSRVRTIGLVGYPNVGKSSTVNVLVAEKKTNVSATPGKTKHFQTLFVPDAPALVLCDCPGLVFPSVAGSKGQMVCDGILPIDQLREYVEPMRTLVERVDVSLIEQKYTIRIRTQEERDDDPDAPELAREILVAHALARGFMTATHGTPDEARSARIILKDLVNAKLLHTVSPPPTTEGAQAVDEPTIALHNPKLPTAPTVSGWFDKMKEEFEAQEKAGGHFAGGKKNFNAQTTRGMHWRPASLGSVPDRMVAQGPPVI